MHAVPQGKKLREKLPTATQSDKNTSRNVTDFVSKFEFAAAVFFVCLLVFAVSVT